MKTKGLFLVLLSALIYGFTPVLCSITYDYGNTPMTLTFFRSFFVVPVLAILMKKDHISFKISAKEYKGVALIAFFGAVLTTVLLYSSYQYVAVGTATTLHFLYPLFVVLICHYVYHDHLKKQQIVALVISLVGVAFFINLNDLVAFQGIIMALISGITFSIYLVGIEKFGLSSMNSYKLSFYIALTVCVGVGIIAIMTNQFALNQSMISYVMMFIVAVLAQFIAVVAIKEGIAILGSTVASMISMLEPVSAVIFGALLLNETVTFTQIIGCAVIIIGVSLLLKK